jgi:hypothetical protein
VSFVTQDDNLLSLQLAAAKIFRKRQPKSGSSGSKKSGKIGSVPEMNSLQMQDILVS